MYLTTWIDKGLAEIRGDSLFQHFFNGIEMVEIEGRYYLDNKQLGLDMVLSDQLLVRTIHLHGYSEGYKTYKGELPFGLLFSMSRSALRKKMGEPAKSGGGHLDIFGRVPTWDKYCFEGFSLHLQYPKKENTIDMITLASLSLEAQFNVGLQ